MARKKPQPATETPQSKAVDQYVLTALAAGCSRDQIENFLAAGIVLQEAQLRASAAARECDKIGGPTKIGYGGARGGGKSHWMLAQMAADDCLRHPGLKCLMLRKVGKALKENFEDLLRKVLGGVAYNYVPTRSMIEFPNGSQILLGHFQRESDIDAYLGLEYDVIGVEEATTLSSSKHRAIETCNRTSKPGWRPRMYSTTNPGNLGHAWYKALFITPYRLHKETHTRFVPATVDDNAFVNTEYKSILDRLTGWQLKAWRYGDWDIAAGQYFTNFRATVDNKPHHVIPALGLIPRYWRRWLSMDYGFTHFTTVYLLCQDGDGNVYIVDEHAERNWLPQRHSPAIKAMLERNGVPLDELEKLVAGADVFRKLGVGASDSNEVHTIATQYAAEGIHLTRANDDRINGAGEMLKRFGDIDSTPAIPPTLFITEKCPQLIECIPTLQHDPNRPEDVLKVDCDDDGIGGDDFYDGARYGLMEATSGGGWLEVAAQLDAANQAEEEPAGSGIW